MKTSKKSKTPIWRKSMLDKLNLFSVLEAIDEIAENGDPYGYESGDEDGYYAEYKNMFDDLSESACSLGEAIRENFDPYDDDVTQAWDDATVGLMGEHFKVLGFDQTVEDYLAMQDSDEDFATSEAAARLMKKTKSELITLFRRVLYTLTEFYDLKAAHDCLTSIVEELDERGAILKAKEDEINRTYKDLTGEGAARFDEIIANIPQRMWIE